MYYLFINIFWSTRFSITWHSTARYFIIIAVLKLLLWNLFYEKIIEILFSLIFFLPIGMVTLHLIQFLKLFFCLLIKLLLYFHLRGLLGSSRRSATLLFFNCFTLSSISSWSIKFLQKRWEFIYWWKFIKAKELLFFYLLIVYWIFANCWF